MSTKTKWWTYRSLMQKVATTAQLLTFANARLHRSPIQKCLRASLKKAIIYLSCHKIKGRRPKHSRSWSVKLLTRKGMPLNRETRSHLGRLSAVRWSDKNKRLRFRRRWWALLTLLTTIWSKKSQTVRLSLMKRAKAGNSRADSFWEKREVKWKS